MTEPMTAVVLNAILFASSRSPDGPRGPMDLLGVGYAFRVGTKVGAYIEVRGEQAGIVTVQTSIAKLDGTATPTPLPSTNTPAAEVPLNANGDGTLVTGIGADQLGAGEYVVTFRLGGGYERHASFLLYGASSPEGARG